jgi:hypothetical protein
MLKMRVKSNFQTLLLSATLISILMIFSSKSYGQDQTGGLLPHVVLLNLALENPILAPAMNTCIRESRARLMKEVKTQEQNLKNIFSKSKLEEATAAVETSRKSYSFWAMTDCFLRFYHYSEKYGLSDFNKETPSIAYYSSFYDDWTDAAFSAAAVSITAKDPDTFVTNGPWTWSDEDMGRIADQAAAGMPIADIQKNMMNERGKVMRQQLNNMIIGQIAQRYTALYEGISGGWVQVFASWLVEGGDTIKNRWIEGGYDGPQVRELGNSLEKLTALTQCRLDGESFVLTCKAF